MLISQGSCKVDWTKLASFGHTKHGGIVFHFEQNKIDKESSQEFRSHYEWQFALEIMAPSIRSGGFIMHNSGFTLNFKDRWKYTRLFFWTFFRNCHQLKLAKPWVFQKKSLSFSENSLSFSESSLSLFKRMEFFPKFPEFSQF